MTQAPLVDEKSNLWLFSPEQRIQQLPVRTWTIPFTEPVAEPFAVPDFESYYSKKYSLGPKTSAWDYVQNPAFNPYLVSLLIVPGNGTATVIIGPPSEMPWQMANGLTWVSHNAGFDELVFRKCVHKGIITNPGRARIWECTVDMLRYLQYRNALDDACRDLLGVSVDKSTRSRLLGGGDKVSDEELTSYIYGDAYWCAVLFCRYGPEWPMHERELSRQTRRIGWDGVWTDDQQLRTDIAYLDSTMQKLAQQIPWLGGKRSITSDKELQNQCLREGIPCPPSVDLTNLETIQWDRTYGQTRPWLHIIKRYTKARQARAFFGMLLDRRRRDGTVPFTFQYCKAPHTKRWQSAGGLRMQNLDTDAIEDVKIRHRMRPRPGEVFIIADCTQIEPRSLNWLTGNTEFLEACAKGMSPYEAHGRQSGWNKQGEMKKVDPPAYALYKAQTLALGYQAAGPKFVQMAREYCNIFLDVDHSVATIRISGKDLWFSERDIIQARAGHGDANLTEALRNGTATIYPSGDSIVKDYRRKAVKTRNYWYDCENKMRNDVGRHHYVILPCGTIRYFDVEDTSDGLRASVVYKSAIPDDRKHFYGGKLTENRVQFFARCVLGVILLRLQKMPIGKVNWHSHDETICRVPAQHADEMLAWTLDAFTQAISWAPGLPLAAEAKISEYYDK